MKKHTKSLFLIITLFLTSCNGQESQKDILANSSNFQEDTISELSKSIWIVFQAKNGDFWFGSNINGVYKFDGKTRVNFTVEDGLSSNQIRGIQEDKKGNLYFSTLGGIDKFDGKHFSTLKPIKSNSSEENWRLQKDDLWFSILGKSGDKGPYRYDGENLYQLEFPKHFLADDYFKKFPNNPWSPYEVYSIYKDRKGVMWFGTANFGICRYDGKTLSWLYEDHLTNTPAGGSFGIRSIIEDRKGKFWFCNTRYRFNISEKIANEKGFNLIKYEKEKGISSLKYKDGTDYIYFQSLIEDDKGDLWMANFNDGVWRCSDKKIQHYQIKDGDKVVNVISIYQDKEGGIWLGTLENGFYKFKGKSFEKFNF